MVMKNQYLEIRFGDNDFGIPVLQALEYFWTNFPYNGNKHNLIISMLNSGQLKEIFVDLVACFSMARSSFYRNNDWDWNKYRTYFSSYFLMQLHNNTEFSNNKNADSDHAGIDLRNGYIWIF